MKDPLNVLLSTAWVLKSDIVQINHDAIASFAQTISSADLPADPGVKFGYSFWNTEEKIALLLIFNAINFSFWPDYGQNRWVVEDQNLKTLDGSGAAFWCLQYAAKPKTEVVNTLYFPGLSHLTEMELSYIFFHHQRNKIPMFEERRVCLKELGNHLVIQSTGDVKTLLEGWGKNAVKAVKFLADIPSFNDVPFYKRAQLAVSMIHRVLLKEWPEWAFEDIGVLTAFADYRLPQVLRGLGVLKYSPDLAFAVDKEIAISAESFMELGLRAATVWAVEYLRQEIEELWQVPVTASQIDTFLWYKARELKDSLKPHHRTRTIAY